MARARPGGRGRRRARGLRVGPRPASGRERAEVRPRAAGPALAAARPPPGPGPPAARPRARGPRAAAGAPGAETRREPRPQSTPARPCGSSGVTDGPRRGAIPAARFALRLGTGFCPPASCPPSPGPPLRARGDDWAPDACAFFPPAPAALRGLGPPARPAPGPRRRRGAPLTGRPARAAVGGLRSRAARPAPPSGGSAHGPPGPRRRSCQICSSVFQKPPRDVRTLEPPPPPRCELFAPQPGPSSRCFSRPPRASADAGSSQGPVSPLSPQLLQPGSCSRTTAPGPRREWGCVLSTRQHQTRGRVQKIILMTPTPPTQEFAKTTSC
nr:basic proline-rich protein-like [Mirounga angustirostris]